MCCGESEVLEDRTCRTGQDRSGYNRPIWFGYFGKLGDDLALQLVGGLMTCVVGHDCGDGAGGVGGYGGSTVVPHSN